ncbi:hypothetical protein [Pyrococcus kukulkanii]|uniref:Uncharacterized protein n=1 Tax=Pyrococcus kukulkanii TaxID=1609559 RepID=A0ABV4T9R3_9EURY
MGMFDPPRHKWLAKIIRIDSPSAARKAVRELKRRMNSKNRTLIIRAANLAANRAKVMLRRKNLSRKERRELREVEKIYRSFVDKYKKNKSRRKKTTRRRAKNGKR